MRVQKRMQNDLHSNNSGQPNYAINKDGTINLQFVTGFSTGQTNTFKSNRQETVVRNQAPKENLNYYYGNQPEIVKSIIL